MRWAKRHHVGMAGFSMGANGSAIPPTRSPSWSNRSRNCSPNDRPATALLRGIEEVAMTHDDTNPTGRAGKNTDALALLIAAGASASKAATKTGMSVSTVKRRIVSDEFKAKVAAIRKAVVDRGVGILTAVFIDGAIALRKIARTS